ncbi:PhzF family phenazine biosynthesis protein [Haloarcula salinisoli]|uniref:PhzF family phenazine biosynthesis protein n=1 Tax=Haloarcula salinisoli TaxID=2487746 RepID=A0A8J8C6I4_9EURY|nr:PhzF family phenazine biosynthesis protein [Halomicroarcula salinisoli]MBX0286176.1 PhzF family phenazine biosynthesis protein [Halomicroarcula salinisoli]MBX0302336.1 PhzF family phenazine biosynthesis protein [Halomicroarcula salinisoli]
MDTRDVLLVDAFAAEPMTGNPAGVVLDASELTDDQMAAIAGELGASATAFVCESERADRRLRFFAPTGEVDRSDHATVAAFATLFERGGLEAGEYEMETIGRTRAVEVKGDGTVWLEQGEARFEEVPLEHDEVADALGIDVATLQDVGADMPMAVADTSEPWLLVPVNYFEHVSRIDPDLPAIQDLCERVDAVGLYAFTFDTIGGEATLHGRGFAPSRGVGEDPVTGTAAGGCAAYVRREGALDNTIDQVVVEQGHFLDRPGTVRVDTDGLEAWVGGRAVTTMDGSMTVPEATEDDDIIEI